jgi:hypothetical protein
VVVLAGGVGLVSALVRQENLHDSAGRSSHMPLAGRPLPTLHLVTQDDPMRKTVDRLQGCLGRELGYRTTGWHEAWIWDSGEGYALFDHHRFRTKGSMVLPNAEGWDLTRVWIRPEMRRRGLLSAAWLTWRTKYGEFCIESPLTSDMAAFVKKRREVFHEAVDECPR